MKRVCSACFEDEDLRIRIEHIGGPQTCDFCGTFDRPTCNLTDIAEYIEACLRKYWGWAVDQLPYVSEEGGYIGRTWATCELLDKIEFSLPRDPQGHLLDALLAALSDELWCDYDHSALDYDVALIASWERFCETVKHERRFFFHNKESDSQDSYSAASLLETIAQLSQRMGLIKEMPVGTSLWRARTDVPRGARTSAFDFGPPPAALATQSNRMNPPGIPMLYLASSARTALKETRASEGRIGKWQLARAIRILDLRNLPSVPGIFSETDRRDRLALRFLEHFAEDIMVPVERDQRVHIDYLPSQVVTEFIRDHAFSGGRIDGVAYGSTVHRLGWNVALFVGPVELGLENPERSEAPPPSLQFVRSVHMRA